MLTLVKPRQLAGVFPRKLETGLESAAGEDLQRREVEADGPLPVVQGDRGGDI